LRVPHQPTEEERRNHEVCHVPYRAWCRHCVAGRGRAEPHYHHENGEDAVPVVGLDYGYLGDAEQDPDASPILFTKDGKTRWPTADVVPSKGPQHPHSVCVLVEAVGSTGYTKATLRSSWRKAPWETVKGLAWWRMPSRR